MIASMTGFAIVNREVPGGRLALELRSVNHRYLEFQCRMPDELRLLETQLREGVAAKLARGKVDCRISFNKVANAASVTPNAEAVARLKETAALLHKDFPDARGLSLWEVLHAPGVLNDVTLEADDLKEVVTGMLAEALADMNASRVREGEKLAAMIEERLARISVIVGEAAPLVPAVVKAYEEKLAAKLAEALLPGADERLRQEVVLFAARVDVAEELSRLTAHVAEVRRILKQGGAAGKRLDFLMQELNREANTLGSKSATNELSKMSVELKVLIEQMREQVQNIE
jgi:uncharacterized protein (TIGR00255 family)